MLFQRVGDIAFFSARHAYFRNTGVDYPEDVDSFVYRVQLTSVNTAGAVFNIATWFDGMTPATGTGGQTGFITVPFGSQLLDVTFGAFGGVNYVDSFSRGLFQANDISTERFHDIGSQLFTNREQSGDVFTGYRSAPQECIFPDNEMFDSTHSNVRQIITPRTGESGTVTVTCVSSNGDPNPPCLTTVAGRGVSAAGLAVFLNNDQIRMFSSLGSRGPGQPAIIWAAGPGQVSVSTQNFWTPVGTQRFEDSIPAAIGDELRIEVEYNADSFRFRNFINGQRVWNVSPFFTPATIAFRLSILDEFEPIGTRNRDVLFYSGMKGNLQAGTTLFHANTISYGTLTEETDYNARFAGFDCTYFELADATPGIITSNKWNLELGLPAKIPFTSYGLQWPISAVVNGLPAGMSFDGDFVRGTPATAGTGTATVVSTDANGVVQNSQCDWIVRDPNASVNQAEVTFQVVTTTITLDDTGNGSASTNITTVCGGIQIDSSTITISDLGGGDYSFDFTGTGPTGTYTASTTSLSADGFTVQVIRTGNQSPSCTNQPVTVTPV